MKNVKSCSFRVFVDNHLILSSFRNLKKPEKILGIAHDDFLELPARMRAKNMPESPVIWNWQYFQRVYCDTSIC